MERRKFVGIAGVLAGLSPIVPLLGKKSTDRKYWTEADILESDYLVAHRALLEHMKRNLMEDKPRFFIRTLHASREMTATIDKRLSDHSRPARK